MPQGAIVAIDAGTTGVTVAVVDQGGAIVSRGYRELTQHYPFPGWVEHDAEEIWQATLTATAQALAPASDYTPLAVGIASQRETFLFWDKRSGVPLHRAIVWQCRRSTAICDELRTGGIEAEVAHKTGLRLDPYFSGTKVLWLTRNDPLLRARIAGGDVCFGTIDSWLAYRLSGGAIHVTDVTNASRTLAFDIHDLQWDEGLLELFGLRMAAMPEVGPSGMVRGRTGRVGPLPDGLPIASLAGDQQAALYGQCCFRPGQAKATYGTGCFILAHTGEHPVFSSRGLLTTPAAMVASGVQPYALEGSIFIAGAAVQWCRDNLGLIRDAHQGEALALSVPDSAGVVFVPAFAGLGSPYWGPDVRGAIYGLTGATTPAHIVRAAMESMVFQAQDVLNIMIEDTRRDIDELRVDGGAAGNNFLMQIQADLSGLPLSRPPSIESTALGAAFLAGQAIGFWRDEAEIAELRQEEARFLPSSAAAAEQAAYERWRTAVHGLLETKLAPLSEDPGVGG